MFWGCNGEYFDQPVGNGWLVAEKKSIKIHTPVVAEVVMLSDFGGERLLLEVPNTAVELL